MEERVYNFFRRSRDDRESVLKKAADELLCYPGRGMSVMEMSTVAACTSKSSTAPRRSSRS